MQPLGHGLGKSVGQRSQKDRGVVVGRFLERPLRLVQPASRSYRESADVVADARFYGRGVVRKRLVRTSIRLGHLLAKGVKSLEFDRARVVREQDDVIV